MAANSNVILLDTQKLLIAVLVLHAQLSGSVHGSTRRKLQQSCNPGEVRGAGGCIPCEIGFYAPTGNEAKCIECPRGFTSTKAGSADCPVCKPAYGGPACALCQQGYYSRGGSLNKCIQCPEALPPLYSCINGYECDAATGTVYPSSYYEDGASCGGGKGKCQNTTCECPSGTGGAFCEPCKPGYWSAGLEMPGECQPCSQRVLCKRIRRPCEQAPPCDAETGKPTSSCWLPKPDGAICKPRDTGSTATYACKAGQCTEGYDVNACEQHPCTQPLDCGLTIPPLCPRCKDLPPPAVNNTRGRRCVCPKGYKYDDKSGCAPR